MYLVSNFEVNEGPSIAFQVPPGTTFSTGIELVHVSGEGMEAGLFYFYTLFYYSAFQVGSILQPSWICNYIWDLMSS